MSTETQRLDPRKKNTVVILFKLLKFHRTKGETGSFVTLLHQEKLLYIAIDYMDEYITFNKQPVIQALDQLPFNFTQEFQDFIKSINNKAMDAYNNNGNEDQLNLIIKAVDLLMTKSLSKYVQPIQILGQVKVLTFNNLACIYKLKKKLALALKSVNFALEIEQRLLIENFGDAQTSIISTKLNKVALLSQSNKHDAAIDLLQKDIIDSCNRLLQDLQRSKEDESKSQKSNKDEEIKEVNEEEQQNQQENQSQYDNKDNNDNQNVNNDEQGNKSEKNEQQKKKSNIDSKIEEVKKYKAYALYNVGVENEYLYFGERAAAAYNEALKLAKELNQQTLILQIESVLEKFKKQ